MPRWTNYVLRMLVVVPIALALSLTPSGMPGASAAQAGAETISAGGLHTCAIRADATLACWGSNSLHQLEGVPEGRFVAVSAGGSHTCAIRESGELACWGNNARDQLEEIPSGKFSSVSAGGAHTCAIRQTGELACWGDNRLSQNHDMPEGRFQMVTVGGSHACAVTEGGQLVCWGNNSDGQLDGMPTGEETGDLVGLDAGGTHTCAVRDDGALLCWGSNAQGQLNEIPTGRFTSVSAAGFYTCAIRQTGELACWGDDSDGSVGGAPGGQVRSVSAGGFHACATDSAGQLACWGGIDLGQGFPTMTGPGAPKGEVDAAYTHRFETTAQSPAAVFSVAAGKLPPGLALEADGLLHGTPSVAGTYAFTVAAANGVTPDAQAQMTLEIVPGPARGGLPPPVAGKTFNLERTEGIVKTKCPGEDSFTGLASAKQVPVGCIVDTRLGTVELTASKGSSGELQSAFFWAGIFSIDQQPGDNRQAVVALVGKLRCEQKSPSTGRVSMLARRGGGGRSLWGSGKGNYKTVGSHGAATVRGTVWLVKDRCDGSTLFKVKQGVVTVRDFLKQTTFTLEPGDSYATKANTHRLP